MIREENVVMIAGTLDYVESRKFFASTGFVKI